ncbi:HNH endonuclease [Streptomyces collinus]
MTVLSRCCCATARGCSSKERLRVLSWCENLITMGNEYGGRSNARIDALADKRDGTDSEREADASAQWLLQPRGGPKVRGPRNFDLSIRKGIQLAEYAHVLGEDAGHLKQLFPDEPARLWGATPVKKQSHPKATALRGQKVGDEVLFYAEREFVAKARVLALLRNPDLARAIWGQMEDGRTWEYIMALGDVVEFKIPAAPILQALALGNEVRYLTLVRAAERRRHIGLLEGLVGANATTVSRPASGFSEKVPLGRQKLLRILGTLNKGVDEEAPTRHAALLMLWSISRLVSGQGRLASWDVIETEVGPLLLEFGGPGRATSLELSLKHLLSSRLWEADGAEGRMPDSALVMPSTGSQITAGLRPEVAGPLKQPLTRAEAVGLLCTTYFQDADQGALLERLGLSGYAHASGNLGEDPDVEDREDQAAGSRARRRVNVLRPDRDPRLVEEVKSLYRHQCQVCGERLETRFGLYSEAAHIQGLGNPHDGPDRLSNLLCLCPNHHVQFDRLFLFVDAEWNVRKSRDADLISPLIRHPDHAIDEKFIEYHRGLCGRSGYGLDVD